MLGPGDDAPDFAFAGTTLHRTLADRAAVVFFFPKAFTPGWTREAGEFRREAQAIRKLGGEIIGVSKDTPRVADEFCGRLDLPYRLVGDAEGRITKAYKAAWPILGLARRVTYVIGRDGKVKLAFRSERDVPAHVAKAKEALAAL